LYGHDVLTTRPDDAQVAAMLDGALTVVRAAGIEAVRRFRRPLEVDDKTGGTGFDPVTEADRAVERVLREVLLARYPGVGFLGEEYGATGAGQVRWVVDPIDGTRAFISGMPTWGTLLGLVVDDRPVAGLVHQPYTDETWLADPVRGARFLHGGQESALATRAVTGLADAVLYSTHPSMLAEAGLLPAYQRLAARVRLQRWGGDCYSFALLAHGFIDLVVDGGLKPYDIIPIIPLIERAGGVVSTLDGLPADGGGTVVAAATAPLHAAALAVLGSPL
jgi:myo-inositol-1(or 4)-monophosphatase